MSPNRGALQVFLILSDDHGNVTSIEPNGVTEALGAEYSSLFPFEFGGNTRLLAYGKETGALDAFQLLDSAPWLSKMSQKSVIDTGFDGLEPFLLGNQPYLMCYSAKDGAFQFYGISENLSLSKPYYYSREREPGATQGFSMVKAFDSLGQLGIMGYNTEDGHVAIFRVSVRTTSPPGVPPLSLTPVWSHQWSRGWTRFAFFQFGGENFFLKTNVLKPNVNIDHILDDLSGSVPVGSHLDLRSAQQLDIVRSLNLPDGGPHFLTYEKTGETTLNRIRSDCLGWTTVASFRSKETASHLVPLAAGGRAMIVIG